MGRTYGRNAALIGLVWFVVCGAPAASQDLVRFSEALRHLDGDHDQSVAALQVLQAGGEPAAQAIHDTWSSLSVQAQTRAVSALAFLAKSHDAAVKTLVFAARSDDPSLRERALSALRRAGPPGWNGLMQLLREPGVGDRAAVLLARAQPDAAVDPLLAAIDTDGGADRPVLRNALGTAVQRSTEDPEPKLRAWLEAGPTPEAVASVAIALASINGNQALITSLVEYGVPRATGFSSQWRLLQSAASAGASDVIDQWAISRLRAPEEWMLRQAAVDVVAARGHRSDARVALSDPYPRVRGRAARVLSGDVESMTLRATLARRDPWPMVRAEAVTSLRTETAAIPVLVAAVDDPMSVVRRAAIEVLAASRHDEGWDRVHARLRDSDEWPEVTAAAIDYVIVRCRTDAVESLFWVVRRAAASHALTEDLNNAARAIVALRALNTREADVALQQLRSAQGVPPTLKMALEQPLPQARRCGPPGR